MQDTIEATIYDSQRRPVTRLGGLGPVPEELVIACIKETFNAEFGPGYSCAVDRIHPDGTREAVLDWAF